MSPALRMAALPAVLLPRKPTINSLFIWASPAVLVSLKYSWKLLMMVALPAVLLLPNEACPLPL